MNRELLRSTALGLLCLLGANCDAHAALPTEPIPIGHEPQFVFDDYVVDNHWAIRYKRQAVERVFHPAEKLPMEPMLTDDAPSYVWVTRDDDGLFRMYYQANLRNETPDDSPGRKYSTRICYAESHDGLHWETPDLAIFPQIEKRSNNVVIAFADRPDVETSGPCLLDVPEQDRRGFRYLMFYRAKGAGSGDVAGLRIIGSHDGVHFDPDSDTRIAHLHSDHHNTISWDAERGEYVLYCRAKHIYRAWGEEMLDTGASRRIARMASPDLWTDWMEDNAPQTILVPDEIDAQTHYNFFYGMPSVHRHGLYWGFLEPFRMNDYIHTELAVSRDGEEFLRFPGRPKLIEYGPEGAWDCVMIFASPAWVEMGDEWWIYYTGWDGPHGTAERNGAIGAAKVRKEGFCSMRGPAGGGVVCTRRLIWPGGDLLINADAASLAGEVQVRVSDAARRPIEGFDYVDTQPFEGDAVAHVVRWGERSLDELRGEELRLEIFLRDADLYSFRAD